MKRHALVALLLASTMATSPSMAASDTATDLSAVAEKAVRAQYAQAGSRVVIVPEKLNSHLRLRPCTQALQTRLPTRQGATTRVAVSVTCPGSDGWTIQVPVQMQVYRQVLVTIRPLARGDSIGLSDVRTEERDITHLGYGYVERLDQIAGRSLARPLSSGTVLEPGQLNGREVVRAGDQVQLIAQLDGIEVRTAGLALDGGDTGARLRVRNTHSGLIVAGVVLGADEVKALP